MLELFIRGVYIRNFTVSFKILLKVLTSLKNLTIKLQMEAGDVFHAYKEVHDLIMSKCSTIIPWKLQSWARNFVEKSFNCGSHELTNIAATSRLIVGTSWYLLVFIV